MVMSKNLESKIADDQMTQASSTEKQSFLDQMDIDPQFKDQLASMFTQINASIEEIVDPNVQEVIHNENLKLVSLDTQWHSRKYRWMTDASNDDNYSQAA